MNLLQTKDYLLLIDEEAKVKEDMYVIYNNEVRRTTIPSRMREPKKLLIHVEYRHIVHTNQPKIIAYRKLNEEAKELDLPELPPFEEIDIEKLAQEHCPEWNYSTKSHLAFLKYERKGFIKGYKAAQSKQFTLEDIKKAINLATTTRGSGSAKGFYTEEEIIQSLSTQQFPSEFIPEYEDVFNKTDSCSILDNNYHTHSKKLKTITNSESKEVLIGTYKY